MMKQKRRKKTKTTNDSKTVLIVIVVFVLIFGIIWFLNSRKSQVSTKKKHVITEKVKVKTVSETKPPVKVLKLVNKKENVIAPISQGKIAFVLDDWGYTMRNCAILSEIPVSLAIAILPNLQHTDDITLCAKKANKVVMLHLPMQPYNNKDSYPDNYLLTTTMSPKKVETILNDILAKMPDIEGVNNHMGSKAMEDKRLLKLIFRKLKSRNLFFVDSKTSPKHSFGSDVAKEYNLPFTQRDVFLDNVNTREAILKQFSELTKKASKKGYAIAIGHDRELTLKIIKEQVPLLEKQGFKIVSIKELLRNP